MKTREQLLLENKLQLWYTNGFQQFIQDLQDMKGPESDISGMVLTLQRLYKRRLEELENKGKLKQTKLSL